MQKKKAMRARRNYIKAIHIRKSSVVKHERHNHTHLTNILNVIIFLKGL